MECLARLVVRSRCREGHDALQIFTAELLERELAAGTLTFSCGRCGTTWEPSVEERIRLRALAKRKHRQAELLP